MINLITNQNKILSGLVNYKAEFIDEHIFKNIEKKIKQIDIVKNN